MPVHDWQRVSAGIFHDFHTTWIVELKRRLNAGILPSAYYAMAEQVAGDIGPDVLTLKARTKDSEEEPGGLAVANAPPRVRFTAVSEMDQYVLKRKTLTIRHSSDDELVAVVEVLSPGNKASRREMGAFVNKVISALRSHIHLLLVDLFPPTRRDPEGVHAVIWSEFEEDGAFVLPTDKRLTLASYSAGTKTRAFIEPVAVADTLPDMPLFLTADDYVLVPLEAAYGAAYEAVPRRWRNVLGGK